MQKADCGQRAFGSAPSNKLDVFTAARRAWSYRTRCGTSSAIRESSVALNLAEGRGKASVKEQRRFFRIAMGSVREAQAILQLAELEGTEAWKRLDAVAASLYKLIQRAG
jgi:four helix bundle protein